MFTSRAQPPHLSGSHASLLYAPGFLYPPLVGQWRLRGHPHAHVSCPCPSSRVGLPAALKSGVRAEPACPASTPCLQVPLRQESRHGAISHCRPQHRMPRAACRGPGKIRSSLKKGQEKGLHQHGWQQHPQVHLVCKLLSVYAVGLKLARA